ncbi:MAG TPA: hypothetical protein VIL97_08185 [Thermoanaerobaculia bacterium]
MEKHVTVVAALMIAFGVLGLLLALFFFVSILGGGLLSGDPEAIAITGTVATALAVFISITAIPELIAGIALLRRKPWARILALVISFLNLFVIPIGTIFGIYAIWVLLNDETIAMFTPPARSAS